MRLGGRGRQRVCAGGPGTASSGSRDKRETQGGGAEFEAAAAEKSTGSTPVTQAQPQDAQCVPRRMEGTGARPAGPKTKGMLGSLGKGHIFPPQTARQRCSRRSPQRAQGQETVGLGTVGLGTLPPDLLPAANPERQTFSSAPRLGAFVTRKPAPREDGPRGNTGRASGAVPLESDHVAKQLGRPSERHPRSWQEPRGRSRPQSRRRKNWMEGVHATGQHLATK